MTKPSSSFLLVCSLLYFLQVSQCAHHKLAPALYVFGDSTVDPGNNNLLNTFARSNYPPYGVDFPGGPSGRPTNGYNIADFFAKSLGLNLPPAFRLVNTSNYNISQGFSYASSASGILNDTATNILKGVLSLGEQVDLFNKTVEQYLPLHLKNKARISKHISRSIFLVVVGANDIGLNLLKKVNSTRPHLYKTDLDVLVEELGNHLTDLYDLGARKFVVFEVEALGCMPFYVNKFKPTNSKCVKYLNDIANMLNRRLRRKLRKLDSGLKGSTFVTGKYYEHSLSLVTNPNDSGLKDGTNPCCLVLPYGVCDPMKPPCEDRNSHAFFDAFHATEAVNKFFAEKCFNGSGSCTPMNVKQLAQL